MFGSFYVHVISYRGTYISFVSMLVHVCYVPMLSCFCLPVLYFWYTEVMKDICPIYGVIICIKFMIGMSVNEFYA